jgi:hypothetical protein
MPSNPYGGGGSLIAWPTANRSSIPAQLEYQKSFLQAVSDNPFTGAQIVQDWGVSYTSLSVAMQPMVAADGQNFLLFLDQLDGIKNVFQFPATFCTNPNWAYLLTYNGGTVYKYFRLKNPKNSATVKAGGFYTGIVFECREAL